MPMILAALTLAAASPAAPEPLLTPPQSAALRCSAVFAVGAQRQKAHDPIAAGWPPLAVRGKEFFVRVMAQLIDDTGASREALAALAAREAGGLKDPQSLSQAMPACLALLDASGV